MFNVENIKVIIFGKKMKNAELTVLIQQDEESGWYVGQIEEFPSAISQGKTIDELQANLLDALNLLLDTQKEQLINDYIGKSIQKRTIVYS